ncbi:DUF4878 domain-containing protein [Mycolicibacterium aichiense]|uniref:Lumazine-binding domain n=1 Tax=Mycolicibacterium aichiense TaxID=1799 RepID=A0AAD1HK88_9MYCO|nr:DUF4878 domain-containing protein [Mycolicibacterium aichiense]MCV7019686.1 DUF4878 domain-containing protein [Mycolicibacterium aichiense]BBX06942.1 hypothetical protein MAIC_17450 [Mycolicibacterium aichiense]STZ80759.1 Lumazine-binding domain [Mycolicibacterium aichiense]
MTQDYPGNPYPNQPPAWGGAPGGQAPPPQPQQGWYGYPPAQPGYGPGGQWPPPPYPPNNNGRRRKPLVITLLASAALLVIVGIVLVIALNTGGGAKTAGAGSAGEAVKAYLEALAKGDADGALALGVAQPASKKFLTNDALKLQISKWPITNIEITEDTSKTEPGNMALVKVSANFGDHHSEGQLPVKKTNDGWKLESATINVDTMSGILGSGPATSLSILGKPLGQDTHLYVFPGYLDMKSTVPYIDVSAKPLLLESMLAGDIASTLTFDYTVNDAGHKAVNTALETWISGCLSAPETQYKCPKHNFDTPINRATAKVDGPIDLSGVTQTLVPMSMSVMTTGPARYHFTAQTTSGEQASFTSELLVSTSVSLAKDPPAVGPLR